MSTVEPCADRERDRDADRLDACEPIHPVHEVEDVEDPDDPHHRQRERDEERKRDGSPFSQGDLCRHAHEETERSGHGDLDREPQTCSQRPHVIDEAEGRHRNRCEEPELQIATDLAQGKQRRDRRPRA